jgi:hypothetical protein
MNLEHARYWEELPCSKRPVGARAASSAPSPPCPAQRRATSATRVQQTGLSGTPCLSPATWCTRRGLPQRRPSSSLPARAAHVSSCEAAPQAGCDGTCGAVDLVLADGAGLDVAPQHRALGAAHPKPLEPLPPTAGPRRVTSHGAGRWAAGQSAARRSRGLMAYGLWPAVYGVWPMTHGVWLRPST